MCHAGRHGSRLLPARTANRKDKSDSAARAAGSRPAGTRGSRLSGRSACACDAFPKGREAITQAGRGCLRRGNFCRHNHIDARQGVLRQTEALSHEAAQAVALDGITRGFYGDSQAHSWMRQPVGLDTQGKESVIDSAAASIDGVELRLASQAQIRMEAKPAVRGLHSGACNRRTRRLQGTIFLRPLARRRASTF